MGVSYEWVPESENFHDHFRPVVLVVLICTFLDSFPDFFSLSFVLFACGSFFDLSLFKKHLDYVRWVIIKFSNKRNGLSHVLVVPTVKL